MNRARWKEIDEQFRQAIDLPEATRTRFVRELLVRNPELGLAVKDLLASAAEAEAVLGESAAVFAGPMLAGLTDEEWDALHPGAIVGGYRLLREIGRAGRSTVYLAEPANAKFATRVAIQVLTRGADADEIIARLVHEREALARLEHRGIARFHDGGATGGGLPYLVIELVDGRPLLAWCDERRLDVTARLEIFLQVCAAVQHAHQHFVAHSDLTASRVLMLDQGTAKIMEFGTARVLSAGAVTTVDDVRALGVILHQLLTGRVPPSAATSASEVALAGGESVSRARGTSPSRLASRLRGDIDAILLRALEQDPGHRYQSAGALADDIVRHLKHRPVHARPASAAYRAGRFVQRHRTRLGIAGLAALALVSAAGMTGFRLSREESVTGDVAQMPAVVAVKPADDAPTAERPSEAPVAVQPPAEQPRIETRGADQPELLAPKPEPAPSVNQPVVRIAAVPEKSRRSPVDSAAMLSRLASGLRKAGKNAEAEAALRQALELSDQENLATAGRQWELGDLLRVTHRYEEAESLLRSSLRIRRQLADAQGAEVGQSLAGLAMVQCEQGRTAESDSLFARAIDIYRRLPNDAGGLRMPETERAQCR